MHACMHACIHIYITYMHACIHAYIPFHFMSFHYITLHYTTLHYIHTYMCISAGPLVGPPGCGRQVAIICLLPPPIVPPPTAQKPSLEHPPPPMLSRPGSPPDFLYMVTFSLRRVKKWRVKPAGQPSKSDASKGKRHHV